MPTVKNQNAEGKLEAGVVLSVSGAASENDAVLAIENYLRVNQAEYFELAVPKKSGDDTYEIRLG
nr:hypothetical protein [uncultured Dyadobacter sp.]